MVWRKKATLKIGNQQSNYIIKGFHTVDVCERDTKPELNIENMFVILLNNGLYH